MTSKVASGCKRKNAAGACPTAGDTAKLQKAVSKAADKIAKLCGADDAAAARGRGGA